MEKQDKDALLGGLLLVGSFVFGKKTGYQEGYNVGYKDGRKAGRRDAYELCCQLGLVDDEDDGPSLGLGRRLGLK